MSQHSTSPQDQQARHPVSHQASLEAIYELWRKRQFAPMLDLLPETASFQVAGKSVLAGKYSRANFLSEFLERQWTLSEQTFSMEVHDILTSDRHALVLTTESLLREGKRLEYRCVHVWRMEGGKPSAWYLYSRDLYQFDAIWN
jgi:ketosteroid isomerase-like protein